MNGTPMVTVSEGVVGPNFRTKPVFVNDTDEESDPPKIRGVDPQSALLETSQAPLFTIRAAWSTCNGEIDPPKVGNPWNTVPSFTNWRPWSSFMMLPPTSDADPPAANLVVPVPTIEPPPDHCMSPVTVTSPEPANVPDNTTALAVLLIVPVPVRVRVPLMFRVPWLRTAVIGPVLVVMVVVPAVMQTTSAGPGVRDWSQLAGFAQSVLLAPVQSMVQGGAGRAT